MKLNKTLGRVATTFLATAMLASVSAVPAFATPAAMPTSDTDSFSFNAGVQLLDNTPYAPDVDITYTLTGMTELPTEATEKLAKSGIDNAIVTQSSDTKAELDADKNSDKVEFVFNPNTFGAPGIYYYKLSSYAPNVEGLTLDEDDYIVKVYVQNKMVEGVAVDGQYEIYSVTMYKEGTYTKPEDADDAKVGGIDGTGESDYAATYDADVLTLNKKLTGNMANMSDVFGFTITITDPDMVMSDDQATNTYASQVKYTVNGTEAQAPVVFNDGVAIINVPAANGIGNSQSITVSGIPETATVEITEADQGYNPATKDTFSNDYDASWSGAVESDESDKTATVASIADGNNTVTVTNNKTTVNPTGIAMDIAPYALLVVVAAAGCFVFLRKRRED